MYISVVFGEKRKVFGDETSAGLYLFVKLSLTDELFLSDVVTRVGKQCSQIYICEYGMVIN